jgi:hypothetical protein
MNFDFKRKVAKIFRKERKRMSLKNYYNLTKKLIK